MVSNEVQPELTAVRPDPDILSFGPSAPNRRARRMLVVVALVLAVIASGLGVWHLWPKPGPDFALADLEGAYNGMARSDGTNDVSVLTRDKLTEKPATVSPAACEPLFDTTLSNQFPATAVSGVSTYWLDQGSATISLFTYQYPDSAAAQQQFDQVRSALTSCVGETMTVNRSSGVLVTQQPVTPPDKVKRYLSYLLISPPATARFSIDVFQLSNTVTWQYRYDTSSAADYSPLAAQQLMSSMVSQLKSIQDSHR